MVYMIDIINRLGDPHAISLSRESLKNLFFVVFYQIGNQQGCMQRVE